jgi:serine protease inhibitor
MTMPNRRNVLKLVLLGATGLGTMRTLTACGTGHQPGSTGGTSQSSSAFSKLAVASTADTTAAVRRFTAELFHQISSGSANLVCSPYSAVVALSMARVGALGVTAEEMDGVLHVPAGTSLSAPLRELAGTLTALTGEVTLPDKTKANVALDVANSLWGQKSVPWLPGFLSDLQTGYAADLQQVDFAKETEAARKSINTWTGGKTHGRIPELVPAGVLDAATRLVLVNAVYLKAPWANPFIKGATALQPFTRLDGSTVSAQLMSSAQTATHYAKGPGWQAADLPYADGHLAMSVIVPDTGRFPAIQKGLDGAWLQRLYTSFAPTRVAIGLPRWTFRTTASLSKALVTLGMTTAFSGQADFGAMAQGEPLMISDVLQQAFIAVDEHGTEAAAATAVVMRVTGSMPPTLRLTADRPFLFTIRHVASGLPLFFGRVTDPTL